MQDWRKSPESYWKSMKGESPFFVLTISNKKELKLALFAKGLDWIQNFNFFFLKSTSTFLFLYHINNFFIIIQIKKSLQNNVFHFFIQNIFFSHINQIYYGSNLLLQVHSFVKHSLVTHGMGVSQGLYHVHHELQHLA